MKAPKFPMPLFCDFVQNFTLFLVEHPLMDSDADLGLIHRWLLSEEYRNNENAARHQLAEAVDEAIFENPKVVQELLTRFDEIQDHGIIRFAYDRWHLITDRGGDKFSEFKSATELTQYCNDNKIRVKNRYALTDLFRENLMY